MKKIWKKIFVAAFPLAIATSFTTMAACTDYSQELEDEYSYLRDEETADNNKEIDEEDDNVSSSDSSNISSADSKSSSSKKNSSSVDDDDTDDNGDKDDSGNKDTPNSSSSGKSSSSSNKKEGTLTSSETIIYETTCENVPYTVKTAGPNHGWGNFGYVIPLKITSSKTQELYLATDSIYIKGPDAWKTYGVLIAQYDTSKNEWIPGTEIFAKEIKSAKEISWGQGGCVTTYGIFERFTFDTKGTWLEKSAGKNIDVVVTFYAPDITSDSSGMGLDYYSIPVSDKLTESTNYKLYFSEKAKECFLPLKIALSETYSCSVNNQKMNYYQGDTIVWTISSGPYEALANRPWFSIESNAGQIVGTDYDNLGSLSSVYVVYSTVGHFYEFLKFTYLPGKDFECKATPGWEHQTNIYTKINDTLEILQKPVYVPPAIQNCTCSASSDSVDLSTGGESVTWTISNCQSDSPITSYEWTGATMLTSTTASYTFTNKGTVSPSVKVTNQKGDSNLYRCQAVKAYDSRDVIVIIDESNIDNDVDFSAGYYTVIFNLPNKPGRTGECYSTLQCSSSDYITIKMRETETVGQYSISIPLPTEYCAPFYEDEISFSAPAKCHISW